MKKCPFCGKEDVFIIFRKDENRGYHTMEYKPFGVMEGRCPIEGKQFSIDDWQTRPLEDELEAENKKLTDEISRVSVYLGIHGVDGYEMTTLGEE